MHSRLCAYFSFQPPLTLPLFCKVFHVGYWKEKHGSVDKLGNYSIETTHSILKQAIHAATNQFSDITRDKNVCQQLLARIRRLRGYDRELGGTQTARKHGGASWLQTCNTVLEEPKAKFDWSRFAAEYPSPLERHPAEGAPNVVEPAAVDGVGIESHLLERALDIVMANVL